MGITHFNDVKPFYFYHFVVGGTTFKGICTQRMDEIAVFHVGYRISPGVGFAADTIIAAENDIESIELIDSEMVRLTSA